MKLKKTFISVYFLIPAILFAQPNQTPANSNIEKPYPRSFIDLSVGIGPNFGFMGVQSIIGYKGIGLLLATGFNKNFQTHQIGGQVAYEWFYISLCYGTNVLLKDNSTNKIYPLSGLTFMSGARINIHPSKRAFLQLGLGQRRAIYTVNNKQLDAGGYTFCVGLGCRLGIEKRKPKK